MKVLSPCFGTRPFPFLMTTDEPLMTHSDEMALDYLIPVIFKCHYAMPD